MTALVDPQSFRRAMSHMATGVTVVTTRDREAQPLGLTISSFGSLSLDPPLILWSITENSFCTPAFVEAEMFAINILADDQEAVSRDFSKPVDRFSSVSWQEGPEGLPLIDGAVAWIECVRDQMVQGGDHRIFIGRVLRMRTFDRRPLLHWRGGYGSIKALATA